MLLPRAALKKMRLRLLAIGLAVLAAGCNTMRQARLAESTAYGMEQIAPRVYVKKDLADEPRLQLLDAYEKARQRVSEFYGGLATDPTVYGCESPECIHSFGGWGDGIAIVLPEKRAILLWPLVFGPGEVAHEWSHLELLARLAGGAGRTVPAWFHEGLATVVGEIPRHSEAVYQRAVSSGYPIPPLSDLRTGAQWGAAFKKYPNPQGLNVVYATAGHEVRTWLERVGEQGLFTLIARIKSGEPFDAVYADLAAKGAAVHR
jgi:hypothetical protein